jgi:hypothetical protein
MMSAAKLKPMKDAWKYLIKKFQNIVFFIFKKNCCTFGLFFVKQMAMPQTIMKSTIPIAATATPSRL